MSDKHNKISIFVYVSILINLIVLALFITFVFGLKKDAFDVDTKKLDRNALICQNSIVNLVKDYDERLNKIVDSYPFINLLQQVILNGIDEAERDRIISIFRSGNYPFDTVALYLADGKPVFSSPAKTKPADLENYKKSKAIAFFDKDYDGVYFVKPIKNDRGIEVGYIAASVFKKIFENTSYNLNFAVLPNGVVYYNPSIDINSISIDSLTQYMNNDTGSSGNIETDNSTFAFYSGKVKGIDNFSVGILELSVPIVQRYLKYIILALLSLSFIFLLTSSLMERSANVSNIEKDEDDEENIYDESEPPINNYANANIVNDEEFDIDDYDSDIEDLDNDSIQYLNKRDKITKNSKIDLPNIDDVEDIKIEDDINNLNSITDYGDIKLDDVLEDGGELIKDDDDEVIKLDDISSLESELDEEIPNLDDVLEETEETEDTADTTEDNNNEDYPDMKDYSDEELLDSDNILEDEEDEIPNLDDVLEETEETEDAADTTEDNNEDYPDMKDYSDEELLASDNILEDEEDEIPNLDDVLEETEDTADTTEDNNSEDYPDMKDYSDEELLDSDNILEDEEDEIPNLDDVLEETEETSEISDTTEDNNEDYPDMKDYSDEELLDSDNILEDEEDEIPNLDDVLEETEETSDTTEDNNSEDYPDMKDYSDEELLDSDNILEDEEDEIPNLDDVLEETEETSEISDTTEDNNEDYPDMKDYSDEELLDSDNILEDEEDEIPNLDDVLEETEETEDTADTTEDNNSEDYPDMKDYSDEELLDSDNILEDDAENEESEKTEESEETSETSDTTEDNNSEDYPDMKDYSDEELLDSDNILEDDNEDLEDTEDIDEEISDDTDNISDDEELEEVIDDSNSQDDDIIKGIDDIIDDNNEGDILISHGSILEDEIVKKEEEYFSSSDAFNFSLNRDFLLGDYEDEESDNNTDNNILPSFNNEEYDDDEIIKPANENDSFDTEDLIDKDLYDPEEVPKSPDDFYREAEEKVKENMTSSWKNVLKSIRGKKFINKNMNDMLNWVKEQSGLDIKHAAMLERGYDGSYNISDSQNISDDTKNKLNIDENEPLFKKILSHKKTLYVSDPFASDSLKDKFGSSDRENISHMIFVPIENDEGGLKSFFIGLSSN